MAFRSITKMEKKIRFIEAVCKGDESFSELCRENEISRKNGYKWLSRYEEKGLAGLEDRSRRPHRCRHETSAEIIQAIVEEKLKHLKWGPKKIRARLMRNGYQEGVPSTRTVSNILGRHHLVNHRKKRTQYRSISGGIERPNAQHANEIWAVDFKGWFKTRDGKRCDPLTITDLYSRYIIACELAASQKYKDVQPIFEAVFKRYGLPKRIRSDNGSPFSTRGFGHLSKLSVWWMTLGIELERIEPGKPEQNGQHERMHKTLKEDVANKPAKDRKAQQKVLDQWKKEFNEERPHEGIGMKYPQDLYAPSSRQYKAKMSQITYPKYYAVRKVDTSGHFYWEGQSIFVGEALNQISIGLRREDDSLYWVYFDKIHIANLDTETMKLTKIY